MKIKNIIAKNYNHKHDDKAVMAEAGYIGGHNRDEPDYSGIDNVPERIKVKKGSRIMAIPPSALEQFKADGWTEVDQDVAETLGDLRPKLGSSRDQGKSVRKWRKDRGMDESGVAEGHTEIKDKEGKVVSWKDDSEWHRAEKNKQGQPKDPRGVVTHLSDVARRKTAAQQDVAEAEVDSNGHSVDHADSGEYDYEGDQAKDQLNTIVRAAQRLNGLLDDNENMPEWVQMKVTLAADYLDTAADYIESNQEPELEEGWKEKLGGAALAGALALGAGGAQARVTPDGQGGFTGGLKPTTTQQATDTAPTQSTSSISVAKPQAQYDVDTQTLTYKGKQYKWNSDAQATGQGEVVTAPSMAVGSRSMGSTKVELNPNGTYTKVPANESQEKVGDMDTDKFDAAMARLKQLAGAGPMKTVYDPAKRVYRNVPVAVQPRK